MYINFCCKTEEIKELPPRFIEFPFFYLPIYFIFKILPSVIITVI